MINFVDVRFFVYQIIYVQYFFRRYETENGILAEEEGHLDKKGTDDEAMQAKGFFKYTGPDNIVYEVHYTANEEGFRPVGAHIPEAPAIPEAILRSLEYQRSIGELKE